MQLGNKKLASKRVRLIIIGLVLVCVAPLFYAWYLYGHKPATLQLKDANAYQIKPAVEFTHLALTNVHGAALAHSQWQRRWVLLFVSPSSCADVCHGMLDKMQFVSQDSAQRYKQPIDTLVVSFSSLNQQKLLDLLVGSYPGFTHAYVHLRDFKRVFSHSPLLRQATFQGMLYLVAPDGKITLGYSMAALATAISHGLNSLLKTANNEQ